MEPNFLEDRLVIVNLCDCSDDDDDDYDGNCDVMMIIKRTNIVTTKTALQRFQTMTMLSVCMDTVITLTKSACSEGIERSLSQN